MSAAGRGRDRGASPPRRLLLDAASAAPLLPEAREAMREALEEASGHPSALHAEGRGAARYLDAAREAAAEAFAAEPEDVVLTSGGTEANALALRGVVPGGGRAVLPADAHPSLRRAFEGDGAGRSVEEVPPRKDGGFDLEAFVRAARETRLAAVDWANHETGRVAPLREIARGLRGTGAVLHVDASQGLGRLDPEELVAADLVAVTGEKLGGPAGIGALVLRRPKRVGPLSPIFPGAAQFGRRAGAVSPILAAGFAAALRAVIRADWRGRAENLRDWARRFVEALTEEISGALDFGGSLYDVPEALRGRWYLASDLEEGLPGHLLLVFPGVSGDALAARLDLDGVSASPGAACASGAGVGAEALAAAGRSDVARAALRISPPPAPPDWGDAARRVGRAVRTLARRRAMKPDHAFRERPASPASPGGYGEAVRRLVAHAEFGGPVRRPDASVERKNPVCGDVLRLSARIEDGTRRIAEIGYQGFGCPPTIAAAEAACRRLRHAPLARLLAHRPDDLLADLPDLPETSRHAIDLVVEAVRALGEALSK